MTFIGEATAMGTSLELSAHGVGWHMSIGRADGKSDPRFLASNGKPVTPADVAQFVPDWRTLVWRSVAESMFSHSKCHAESSAYQITLSGTRDSSLSPEDVIRAFEQYMASCDR